MAELKLISLNLEGHRHLHRALPFLEQQKAEIICFQEVFQSDLALLEKKLQMKAIFTPTWRVSQNQHYHLGQDLLGIALFSTLAHQAPKIRYYHKSLKTLPGYLGPGTCARALLWTNFTKNQQNFTIATTHFTWGMPDQTDEIQKPHLKKLLKILKAIPEFVLAGDFNAPRGQKTYKTLAKLYTDHIPVSVTSTLDPHLHYANRKKPNSVQLVVDYVFSTRHYQAHQVKIRCGLSDHCAVIAQIEKL
jgi:endonuclease/exonuclease/phosphatase family metal-dependent hydrolase